MRNPLSKLALSGLLAFAAGCGEPQGTSDDPADIDDPSEIGEAASDLSVAACGGRRWISQDDPSSTSFCETAAGFDAEPLFPQGPALPGALAGYCLHTWTGQSAPTKQEIADWTSGLPTTDLAEDCTLVTPLGLYEDHLAAMLHGAITQRIGVVSGAPEPGPLVHVAVLDTTPDAPAGLPVLGANRHGDTLAALIGDVVQVPGAAAISTTLAMPRTTDPATGEAAYSLFGGHYGYLSDLSRALWRAVTHHQKNHAGERLVMNLSLGWEPHDAYSSCSGNMLPAARAVRDVLDVATCKAGAVIVAAAGNDMGGPTPGTGLMCPAAWMTQSPSCDPQRALVIGAYGLDHSDAPLAIARPGSATPFAAPGLGGVAWPAGAPLPPPLTGTSVAAAAVTASIAAVWAASPGLDQAGVVELLHQSAAPLGTPADECAPGVSACDVRRISPCGALSALGSPWACLSSALPSPVSNPDLDPLTQIELLAKLSSAAAVPASLATGPLPSDLAPAAGGQSAVSPQPIIPVCPSCALALTAAGSSSNPVFYGSLDRAVSSLTLVVTTSTSSARYSLSVSSGTTTLRATLPPSAASARSAWISAADAATGLSILEQVLVAP